MIKAYLVIASSGGWSDYQEWIVEAFFDNNEAEIARNLYNDNLKDKKLWNKAQYILYKNKKENNYIYDLDDLYEADVEMVEIYEKGEKKF